MKGKRDVGVPEFQSLEEERKYWEARGPLAEGHEGRINKPGPRQKRSSFLVVRLTGEELTRLRDVAAKQGIGPSTFARNVLMIALDREEKIPRVVTLEDLKGNLERKLPQALTERLEEFAKDISIGDPENPALIIIDANQRKDYEQLIWSFFGALLGLRVIIPEDERYKEISDIVERETRKEVSSK